jgi:geranial dehydrogenase
VLDDVDLNLFVERLPMAAFLNNGQTCFASTRILAPRSRYSEIVDAVTSTAAGLKVGNALDATTQIGPMASLAHRERVEGYIQTGKSEGRMTTGGSRPSDLDRGYFVQPTVFADVSNDARIAREEIFGPVLSIIPYDNDADAVKIANSSEFGLGGTIWSADEARALSVASRVSTGTIGINGYAPAVGSPFGGVKASGLGRELGPEALQGYFQLKSTYVM